MINYSVKWPKNALVRRVLPHAHETLKIGKMYRLRKNSSFLGVYLRGYPSSFAFSYFELVKGRIL